MDTLVQSNDLALKLYFNEDMNTTKLEEIDVQLSAQGLRYPVYDWVSVRGIGNGKFVKRPRDKRVAETADFRSGELRSAVARQFAKLHGGGENNELD